MKKFITFILTFSLTPFVIFADLQNTPDLCKDITLNTLGGIINWAGCTLVRSVIPFLFSLAVAGFIYGIIQYVINADNEEKRKKGKVYMLWGIIALFVMIAMWGLVGILTKTLGIQTLIPQLSQ